jgi:hypothetical protein
MSIELPRYVKEAPITDPRILYRWEDWDVDQYLDEPDEALVKWLEPLCHRANVALAIGMTEWLVRRFSRLGDDCAPLLIIEAAWAQLINRRYSEFIELNDEDWQGPIRRPMQLALESVQEILVACFDDDDTAEETASVSKLVLHILPVSDGFTAWRTGVIARLSRFYTKHEDDPVGPVIPREALDLSVDFTPGMTNDLITRFLTGLSPATNGWLNSIDEMRELRFDGVPYRWDADRDQDRFL